MADRTDDGRPLRMLTIMDVYTRECLAIDVERHLTSEDVLERLADLFVVRGGEGRPREAGAVRGEPAVGRRSRAVGRPDAAPGALR